MGRREDEAQERLQMGKPIIPEASAPEASFCYIDHTTGESDHMNAHIQTVKCREDTREQPRHGCIACPVEVRGLFAVAFNLLNLRKDPDRWNHKIGERLDELQVAVDRLRPIVDAHFKDVL